MGSWERQTYGHGTTARAQARAARRYFVTSGRELEPLELSARRDLIPDTSRGWRLAARKRFHSVESLAVELNMTERQVRGLRERGMPAKRIGKRLVFDMDEVEAFLERI